MRVGFTEKKIRVKICGITNESDARAAIECGADALGFNLYQKSPRYLDLTQAQTWLERLPSGICKVAVTVDMAAEAASGVAALPFIDCLQLHGNESPGTCRRLADAGVQFAKAIPVGRAGEISDPRLFGTPLLVLDSVVAGKFGGTGRAFPWSVAAQFVKTYQDLHVILAGGLTPRNVQRAVREVGPFGVDVTTGVESAKGKKDRALMQRFVRAVRSLAN